MSIKEQIANVFSSSFSVRKFLAIGLFLLITLIIILLFTKKIPAENKDAALLVLGMLVTKMGTIIDWNFGNSKSKDDQDKIDALKSAE